MIEKDEKNRASMEEVDNYLKSLNKQWESDEMYVEYLTFFMEKNIIEKSLSEDKKEFDPIGFLKNIFV